MVYNCQRHKHDLVNTDMLKQFVFLPRIIIALSVFLLSATPEALACRVDSPFDIEDIDGADVIFSGQVVKYELIKEGNKTFAKMTVEVRETFKGNPSILSREVVWGGGVSRDVAKDFTKFYEKDFVVGVRKPPPWGSGARPQNSELLDLYWVIQKSCSPPFIFEYDNGHLIDLTNIDFTDTNALRHFPGTIEKVEQALRARGMLQ